MLFKLLVNWIEMMRPVTFEGPLHSHCQLCALQQVCLSIPQYLMEKHLPNARNHHLGAKELLALRIYSVVNYDCHF